MVRWLVAVWVLFASPAAAWAQAPPEAVPTKENWALGYALVVLSIGLGLASVLRPGRRTAEFKREQA